MQGKSTYSYFTCQFSFPSSFSKINKKDFLSDRSCRLSTSSFQNFCFLICCLTVYFDFRLVGSWRLLVFLGFITNQTKNVHMFDVRKTFLRYVIPAHRHHHHLLHLVWFAQEWDMRGQFFIQENGQLSMKKGAERSFLWGKQKKGQQSIDFSLWRHQTHLRESTGLNVGKS